jgi:hypothetical protein
LNGCHANDNVGGVTQGAIVLVEQSISIVAGVMFDEFRAKLWSYELGFEKYCVTG